jgi:hypothetical protein
LPLAAANALEGHFDAFGDEVERGSALHGDRVARMMGQHEHRMVIRRHVAPPARPSLIRPGAADRPEHVATHNRGADVLIAALDEPRVQAVLVAFFAEHALLRAGLEHPGMEQRPPSPSGLWRFWFGPAP